LFKKQNELIKQLTDKQIIQNLYMTQLILLAIAVGLSFLLFDQFHEFLILFNAPFQQALKWGVGLAIIVIIIDYLIFKGVPEKYVDDGGINEKIFSTRSILHIFILTAIIAFSEELLFRGILQTHFGLVTASIIFAILHFRYLSKWVLFTMVVTISFFIGIVYEITGNLVATMIAHFLIDFVSALQIRMNTIKGGNSNEG